MSSQSRRYLLARPGPGEFKPPNVLSLGGMPFGASERIRLSTWLSDAAWPRAHMDMVELEGFLVALISWPVGISAGAWLPAIWGVRGWKVPANITSNLDFDEFVRLTVGFMQELDRDLSRELSQFESSAIRGLRGHVQTEAMHRWGRGFMTALTLGSQGFKGRNENAVAAVRVISSNTSAGGPSPARDFAAVVSAVLALVKLRESRGPLGPLAEVMTPDSSVVRDSTQTKK